MPEERNMKNVYIPEGKRCVECQEKYGWMMLKTK
jgi:hypothetical protein